MRFSVAVALLVASGTATAFAPAGPWGLRQPNSRVLRAVVLRSTLEEAQVETTSDEQGVTPGPVSADEKEEAVAPAIVPLTASDVNARLEKQLEKLRQKDSTSPQLSKEELNVVFEDDHIVVVDKPAGVLCVPNKVGSANLAEAVYEHISSDLDRADKMVVHRLGMDTSGLVVFAKNMKALRGLNTAFRARKVERTYEALVCGHMERDSGIINLPLMRDYEHPPFMRVSTDEHQKVLAEFDADEVGKKLLVRPKDSLTHYKVVAKEEFQGNDVTRVSLTSVSGRTHQLNVHLAAFGHPIVGDMTYGVGGDAAPNGGLSEKEQDAMAPNRNRASQDLQKAIAAAANTCCVHAKSLKFRHPVTGEEVSLTSNSPF